MKTYIRRQQHKKKKIKHQDIKQKVCKLTMEKAEVVVEHAGRGSSKGGGQVLQTVKGRCQADCIQLVRVHPVE